MSVLIDARRRPARHAPVTPWGRGALWLGTLGAVCVAIGSYGAGATRYRGGVLAALGWEAYSYGHGAGIASALCVSGMVAMILAWGLLGRAVNAEAAPLPVLRRCLVGWVAPLLVAAPLFSRDVYSYLMQGAMLRDGFDPYSEGAAANPGVYLLEVSHDWRNTTTPYGPLHLLLGKVITSVAPENVTAGVALYKAISLAGFVAIAAGVGALARRMNVPPAGALWLSVANPLMIFHLVAGMHNESVMVALVTWGLVWAYKGKMLPAVALISLAVTLKATAVFALPFVVWMATRRLAGARALPRGRAGYSCAFVLSGIWVTAVLLIILEAVTVLAGSNWLWVTQISGNSKVINPLAVPSLLTSLAVPPLRLVDPDVSANAIVTALRMVCSVLMLVGLVVVWWRYRHTDKGAITGTAAAYLVVVTLNSVTLPWYYSSLIALLGVVGLSTTQTRWAVGLSAFVALLFMGSGNHYLYKPVWLLLGTVLGLATAFIALPPRRRVTAPSPARAASLHAPGARGGHR